MKIRLIACIDFEADSIREAYSQFSQAMKRSELSWESSDEFYVDGEEGDPADLQEAIEDVVSARYAPRARST